jgi:hypothetical protein
MLEVRTIGLIQNDLPQLSRLGATYQRGPAR